MNIALSRLVGEELEDCHEKWRATVAAPNGSIYGIPWEAPRVAKFNPVDESITHIGPDFNDNDDNDDDGYDYRYDLHDPGKWYKGAITESGVIYCPPNNRHRGILKIDTNTDDVTELNRNLLPEQGGCMWESCAAALDGCIYFMPRVARRIMKLDPNNNDAMSCVGDNLGIFKFMESRTLIGIDGCVYGLFCEADCIVKYDPINDITSFIGDVHLNNHGGAMGIDGCIYALGKNNQVLKIDTTNNTNCFVGNRVDLVDHYDQKRHQEGWGDAILGIDGCIYWPPGKASRILKYDPHTDQTLLVGDEYGNMSIFYKSWCDGALAPDGVIYCFPSNRNHILSIDPLKELSMALENKIEQHPQEFGFLFQKIREKEEENPSPIQTNFDHAVIKFGQEKVLEVLDEHMEPVQVFCKGSNLCSFMIVASSKESTVSAIHHFLRPDLSWVACIRALQADNVQVLTEKKRKHNSI